MQACRLSGCPQRVITLLFSANQNHNLHQCTTHDSSIETPTLVNDRVKCPQCDRKLHHHNFTHPYQVVDLEDCFYMIGTKLWCLNCKHSACKKRTVTYNSWDLHIIKALPPILVVKWPAVMSDKHAISTDVFALMWLCFNYSVGSKQFSYILLSLHHCQFSKIHIGRGSPEAKSKWAERMKFAVKSPYLH